LLRLHNKAFPEYLSNVSTEAETVWLPPLHCIFPWILKIQIARTNKTNRNSIILTKPGILIKATLPGAFILVQSISAPHLQVLSPTEINSEQFGHGIPSFAPQILQLFEPAGTKLRQDGHLTNFISSLQRSC
jgi:hypothetical protein